MTPSVIAPLRPELDPHIRAAGRPGMRIQLEQRAGSALRHLGGVVDEQRPGPDRVVEARAGLGPRVIDLAHTRGADYPKGVEPAVRQHGPDLGGAGGHQSRVGAHGLPVTALAPCQPLGGRGRSSGPAGHPRARDHVGGRGVGARSRARRGGPVPAGRWQRWRGRRLCLGRRGRHARRRAGVRRAHRWHRPRRAGEGRSGRGLRGRPRPARSLGRLAGGETRSGETALGERTCHPSG